MGSIEKAMQRKRSGAAQKLQVPTEEEGPVAAPSAGEARSFDPSQRAADLTLDRKRMKEYGLLTPEDEDSSLREQYRMVKRRLIGQAFGQTLNGTNPSNLIEVTSSVDGEGKTFTTFNLGVSIAMERDVTVLLVDADLTQRSLTRIAGLNDAKGLSEFLTGEVRDLSDVVFRTDLPRMAIIPSGASHPEAPELVASESMRACTRELAGRYSDRLILFDTTPLLMNSQAATLASHMGQLLLVVEAGRTSEAAVRDSLALFSEADVSRHLLLNKSVQGSGYGYYGYGGY
jgi:receptor protein-tyrosine kinase